MTTRRLFAAFVALIAAVLFAGPVPAAPAPAIGPWLAKHCGDCHAGGTKEGGVSLDGVAAFKDLKPDVWATVHEQLQLALMPPSDAGQPSAEERAQVLAWVAGAMKAAGHHVVDKLALPNFGNYVPHEPLFRGEAHPAPATPARAWRVRPDVYENRVGGIQPFAFVPGQQISDYASLYEVDESSAEVVLSNAQAVVETWVTGQFKPLLDPKIEPTGSAIDAAVKQAYEKAIGRGPTAGEAEFVRTLYLKATAAHGRERGVRAAVVYPFLRPEAYYRLEVGAGEPDAHGRRRLPKEGIVTAIQQTLFGNTPQPALQAALADEKTTLGTKADVASLVRDLLDAQPPGTVNARVLQFFDEYFDYRKAAGVFKEPQVPVIGNFVPGELVRGTSRLVQRVVADDRDVFRRLLTTREAFLSARGESIIYNVPPDIKFGDVTFDATTHGLPPDPATDGLVSLDPAARCGILSQPAWLVAHSGNFDNDPVRRGKWILEHLLGGTVPDVPVTVCAKVPDDPTRTLRDRFRVVSDDSYCWKCHHRMNQLGMAFETYDHFGRYRMNELDRPVDASGAVVDSGVPALDGPVKDAVELIERLAQSPRAEEMFVRYAFRFFLGRNETLRDAKTLRDAHAAYVTSQGSMKALVTSLVSSDSFLYRFEPAPQP